MSEFVSHHQGSNKQVADSRWTRHVENTAKQQQTPRSAFSTFGDLIESVQAEGQVRVSRVVLEDPAVRPGATVDSQTGVVVPAHQRPRLRLLAGAFTQTGAARAQLPQDELADAQVEAQDHDVDAVDQQQTGSVIPVNKKNNNISLSIKIHS